MTQETNRKYDHDAVHIDKKDPILTSSLLTLINFLKLQPCDEQIHTNEVILQPYSMEYGFPQIPLVTTLPKEITNTYCFNYQSSEGCMFLLNMTVQKPHLMNRKLPRVEVCSLEAKQGEKVLYQASINITPNCEPIIKTHHNQFWIDIVKDLNRQTGQFVI